MFTTEENPFEIVVHLAQSLIRESLDEKKRELIHLFAQ